MSLETWVMEFNLPARTYKVDGGIGIDYDSFIRPPEPHTRDSYEKYKKALNPENLKSHDLVECSDRMDVWIAATQNPGAGVLALTPYPDLFKEFYASDKSKA